ncbi:hypothetical protein DFQ29_007818 [Apophysomyces sp. BC1021]|nr:hypothetical protein DFQ29_007818 [Apophysomyces sp. BC1021]
MKKTWTCIELPPKLKTSAIDFFALTLCDLLQIRPLRPTEERRAPALIYFIERTTFEGRISCHIAVVALIYIERCKKALPKHARGDQDTAHRIFLAALLLASKFLHGTSWGHQPDEDQTCWLTNARIVQMCPMYSLKQIQQFERSLLHLIEYRCWVEPSDVQSYLLEHRQDLML